jgi:hypothetical protein
VNHEVANFWRTTDCLQMRIPHSSSTQLWLYVDRLAECIGNRGANLARQTTAARTFVQKASVADNGNSED